MSCLPNGRPLCAWALQCHALQNFLIFLIDESHRETQLSFRSQMRSCGNSRSTCTISHIQEANPRFRPRTVTQGRTNFVPRHGLGCAHNANCTTVDISSMIGGTGKPTIRSWSLPYGVNCTTAVNSSMAGNNRKLTRSPEMRSCSCRCGVSCKPTCSQIFAHGPQHGSTNPTPRETETRNSKHVKGSARHPRSPKPAKKKSTTVLCTHRSTKANLSSKSCRSMSARRSLPSQSSATSKNQIHTFRSVLIQRACSDGTRLPKPNYSLQKIDRFTFALPETEAPWPSLSAKLGNTCKLHAKRALETKRQSDTQARKKTELFMDVSPNGYG